MEVTFDEWTEGSFWEDVSSFSDVRHQRRSSLISERFTRSHFDYAILFILGVYAFTCFVLVISSFGRFWHQFSQIWWPFLTLTDVFAFAAAWISTRSDGGAVFLS